MKIALIAAMFALLTVFPAGAEEIVLTQQAALDLCSFHGLAEGVIDILYLNADEFWHKGDYKSVFPVLKLITAIKPGEVHAWALGSWFLINAVAPPLKEKEKKKVIEYAIKFSEEGIKKNPGDATLYMELAMHYFRTGNYEKALSLLEDGERCPHSYHLLHLKAHIYRKLGMKEEELKEWEKIERAFPEMKDVAEKFIREIREDNGSANDN
jgi:tetratricopeptide (TPR) repeat protein